jgi:hypothetical protein
MEMETSDDFALKRRLVGLIAIGCFVMAGVLWLSGTDPRANPVLASLPRVGIVLATLWYALPRDGANFVWSRALAPVLIVIGLMALLRRAAWWILPASVLVALALVIIRPKKRSR